MSNSIGERTENYLLNLEEDRSRVEVQCGAWIGWKLEVSSDPGTGETEIDGESGRVGDAWMVKSSRRYLAASSIVGCCRSAIGH